jgi:putative PIN family toxin of toxin-antitoxin system
MKAVLDTNVLISGVISTGVPHEVLVKGFEGEYDIVVSVETLTEFRGTLRKYPERFHMDEQEIQQEVETVRYFAEFVDPDEEINAVEDDPDDDKFVEAAVAGDVDFLVSGDSHLLSLDSYGDVDIVTPRTFYEQLAVA